MRSISTGLFLALLLTASACSDGVRPGETADESLVRHEGTIDPQGGTFLLSEIEAGDVRPLRLQLIGRNLLIDVEASTVSLEVALRNSSDMELHPQLNVWLSDFRPEGVMPTNADLWPPTLPGAPDFVLAGYTYSDLVGEDGVLSPGEDSEFKPWIFYDEGLAPFRFAAEVEFSLRPTSAVLAGTVFNDADGDGEQGPNEMGFRAGVVFVDSPDATTAAIGVGPLGRYETTVTAPGLYTLRYLPPPTLTLVPLEFTTPNPLEVLLTPDVNGVPQSYRDADFGVRTQLPIPAVEISDRSPEEIPSDPFSLEDAEVADLVLRAAVGFSGCGPDHPFTLTMAGGFMESEPVQATLVLSHDDLGELCAAYFQRRVLFDLTPIVRLYRQSYGEHRTSDGADVVLLNLRGFDGAVRQLRFEF